MNVWTKRGYDIFSPTDAAGLLRSVLNGDVQVWATEVERLFKAGSFNSVDAVGLYADRSTYDGEAEGFVYLSIDGDGAGASSTVAFIKESAASGDWSPPVPFQGDKGWSPLFRVVNDGARRLLEVYDWIGGDGEKPDLIGYIGAAGLTPNIAEAVDIRGPQGVSGSGLSWSFEAGTADEDPGAGNLRANAADLSAATELFVSKVSAGGDPVASFLAGLTNSTSTHKGYLILTEPSSGAQATYDVTGTTDAAGYVKIAVSGHSGAAALTDAALLSVVFSRTGNAGDLNGVNPGAAGLSILEAEDVPEFWDAIEAALPSNLFVDPAGSDSNDGLTVSTPFATIQKAFDTLAKYGPVLQGFWNINIAAGTVTEGAKWPLGLTSLNRVLIQGPEVTRDEPTAIIDGTSAVRNVGLNFGFRSYIRIKDMKIIGFNAMGEYGILNTDFSDMYLDNVWLDGNYFNIGSRVHTRLIKRYGKAINGGYANVLMVDFCLCTIGYTGSTVYSGSGAFAETDGSHIGGGIVYGVFASENCQGHIDYCLVDGNDKGLFMAYGTRMNTPGTQYSNNNVGVEGNGGSWLLDGGTAVYSGNGRDFKWGSFSGRVDSNFYADVENIGQTAFLGRSLATTPAPATLGSYQKHVDAFATLPGGALRDERCRLKVRAAGSIDKGASASGRLMAFRLYAGGNFLAAGSLHTNSSASGNIVIDIEVFASSLTAQKSFMHIVAGSSRLSFIDETFYQTSAIDLSADQPLHIYTWRDSGSDDVTFEVVSAELYGSMD